MTKLKILIEKNISGYIYNLIPDFIELIRNKQIEIYNEASIQFELAIFLRSKLPPSYKIQLERNITCFNKKINKTNFEKKEIDLVIFTEDKGLFKNKLAIELKYPINGQYPEQMFSFAKDLKFLEQLTKEGYKENLFIVFADDPNFWGSEGKKGSIYYWFRKKKEFITRIKKPTGKKDKVICLKQNYKIDWKLIKNNLKYFVIKVK